MDCVAEVLMEQLKIDADMERVDGVKWSVAWSSTNLSNLLSTFTRAYIKVIISRLNPAQNKEALILSASIMTRFIISQPLCSRHNLFSRSPRVSFLRWESSKKNPRRTSPQPSISFVFMRSCFDDWLKSFFLSFSRRAVKLSQSQRGSDENNKKPFRKTAAWCKNKRLIKIGSEKRKEIESWNRLECPSKGIGLHRLLLLFSFLLARRSFVQRDLRENIFTALRRAK